MKRLPKTREVIAEVTKIASAVAEREKIASYREPGSEFNVSVAKQLAKLAGTLRTVRPDAVTYDEVLSFGQGLLRRS
jgi:hypothetical protein